MSIVPIIGVMGRCRPFSKAGSCSRWYSRPLLSLSLLQRQAKAILCSSHEQNSPGNDYSRIDNSSFKDCVRRCDAQAECNAFTYNQLHNVCFLKHSANKFTTFYAFSVTGVKRFPSTSVSGNAASTRGGSYFLIIPKANSPGNDYARLDHFSYEDCRDHCATDNGCNAFTYNHAHGVCFLKRTSHRTTFYAWAITGIKLSSGGPVGTEEVQPPSSPTVPPSPQIATPSNEAEGSPLSRDVTANQARAPQPSAAPVDRQVATPSKEADAPVSQLHLQQSETVQAPEVPSGSATQVRGVVSIEIFLQINSVW